MKNKERKKARVKVIQKTRYKSQLERKVSLNQLVIQLFNHQILHCVFFTLSK